jgi:hypothetical protein
MLMDRGHWFMVPPADRRRVLSAYRAGQERRMDPSPEYLMAAMEAVIAVAIKEGRPEAEILQAPEVLGYWAWLQMLGAVPADMEPALTENTKALVPAEARDALDFGGPE